MTREVPTSKQVTVWRVERRWYIRKSAAYYAIAKKLVAKKYPRWLDDHDLESVAGVPGSDPVDLVGDVHAEVDGIADWRARRERRQELFWRRVQSSSWDEDAYEGFDPEKWQRFVRRVARFLMFVDHRRESAA